jgi:hypothetical protein
MFRKYTFFISATRFDGDLFTFSSPRRFLTREGAKRAGTKEARKQGLMIDPFSRKGQTIGKSCKVTVTNLETSSSVDSVEEKVITFEVMKDEISRLECTYQNLSGKDRDEMEEEIEKEIEESRLFRTRVIEMVVVLLGAVAIVYLCGRSLWDGVGFITGAALSDIAVRPLWRKWRNRK